MMIGGIIFTIIFYSARIFAHCEEPLRASGGGSGVDHNQYYEITDFIPVGPGYGNNFSQQEIDSICSAADSVTPFDNDIPFADTYIIVEYDQSLNRLLLAGLCTRGNGIYTTRGTWPDTFSVTWYSTNNSYVGHSYVYVDLDDYSASWYRWTNTYFDSSVFNWFTQFPNNKYYLEKGVIYSSYPLKCPDTSYNGDVIFKNVDSSGGVSDDNQDIIDNIEDTSDLPQVDDSAPNDPTNIPSWLQKILTGLKTFNKNLLGVGKTIINKLSGIGNRLKDIFDKLKEFFDTWVITFDDGINAIISAINGLKDGTTQEQAKNAWVDGFNNWSLKPALDIVSGWGSGFHSSIDSAVALTDYSYDIPMPPIGIPNLTTGQTDLIYLFGRSITIDLNWYVQPNFFGKSPREYLTEFVIPWLILSFAVSLFFKIPGILGGASDNMTMIKDLTTNNINSGKVGTYGGILSQTKIEPL